MRLVLAFALLLAACRGDAAKCNQGCRNYARLVYAHEVDAKVAAAPADQRDALRKQLLDRFESELQAGLGQCVSQCQSANNTDDTECMIAAKTADQARACFK